MLLVGANNQVNLMLPVGGNHQVNKKCRVFLAETECVISSFYRGRNSRHRLGWGMGGVSNPPYFNLWGDHCIAS